MKIGLQPHACFLDSKRETPAVQCYSFSVVRCFVSRYDIGKKNALQPLISFSSNSKGNLQSHRQTQHIKENKFSCLRNMITTFSFSHNTLGYIERVRGFVTVMMLLAFNQNMMSRYFFVRRAEMLLRSWIKGGPPFLVTHSIALTPTHTHTLLSSTTIFPSPEQNCYYLFCFGDGDKERTLWSCLPILENPPSFLLSVSADYCIAHALGIRGARSFLWKRSSVYETTHACYSF